MAENHPVGFRWVMQAKQRGAKLIHVDPRFTRTSAVSDIHAPIRAGSDIAFLGALISYVIENNRYFKEYVDAYTNAAAIISEEYQDAEDLDGLFSGWEQGQAQYSSQSWSYQSFEHAGKQSHQVAESHAEKAAHFQAEHPKRYERDDTLQHPRYANVFALGDASSLPTSKTGAAIRSQAPVLVANLIAAMRGKPIKAQYDGYASCPLVTGYGRLILADFNYDKQPRETFPFDQRKERLSMYLLKKHFLPQYYWHRLLRGRR